MTRHADPARAAYLDVLKAARAMRPTRAERGLPHHPDGSGLAECPACHGAGDHTINETNPHGFGADPQCDVSVPCARCDGNGYLEDGQRDPILEMRELRRGRLTRRPVESYLYGRLLQRVASDVPLPSDPYPLTHAWPKAA